MRRDLRFGLQRVTPSFAWVTHRGRRMYQVAVRQHGSLWVLVMGGRRVTYARTAQGAADKLATIADTLSPGHFV